MPKFVPRVREQKARQRAATHLGSTPTSADTNAAELLPNSRDEREERRCHLREELRARQPESRASSKKNKRLEKYIDLKLRKEENLDLIKKLANTKIDTALFRSSKRLGRGIESKKEKLGRVLREHRAGVADEGAERILFEVRPRKQNYSDDNSASEHEPDVVSHTAALHLPTSTSVIKPIVQPSSFGGGLKRPLDTDDRGNPIIKKRQRTRSKHQGSRITKIVTLDNSDWEGFSSESDHEHNASSQSGDDESTSIEDSDESSDYSDEGSMNGPDADDENSSDETSSGEEDEKTNNEEAKAETLERASSFKAWATQQRNQALGFTPSTPLDLQALSQSNAPNSTAGTPNGDTKPNEPSYRIGDRSRSNTFLAPTVLPSTVRHVYNVPVTRSKAIQEVRIELPVVAEEQKIMEVIHDHDCVIVWGATGSGKTTQVPQFLFEAGYGSPAGPTPGLIGVTQPRRVAAVSMAKRVAVELGDFQDRVAHQIRFDSSVNPKTAIKFMTDGVLLREISQDFVLSKYSAIVLDEAHERSVNTDLLIGMLSRIVDTRADLAKKTSKYQPLKLIIMSATLSTAELTNNKFLFRKEPPPVVQAEGRQHPVTVHFARVTQRDYLEETFLKVSRGHRKLPPGGILVFLTGQNEIMTLAKRLKETFASTDGSWKSRPNVRVSAADASIEDEDIEFNNHSAVFDNEASESESEIRGVDNDEDKEFDIGDQPQEIMKIHVLPLYSQLPTDQQMRIFQPPPDGSRLIVLATNVAETSLTIPGIRYVFDCGRAKQKNYHASTGVQSFEVGWISKASASQRAGRAGRTGPGHCYRLYSSAVFERDFAEFAKPEITRVPVEGVVLQLKSMGIPNVADFPFPTPPARQSLVQAERLLEYLGAISNGKVTAIGKDLSIYPLSPRLSRALSQAQAEGVVDHGIALVAALTVPDIFIPESQLNISEHVPKDVERSWTEADNREAMEREQKRKAYNTFHGHASRLDRASDAMKILVTLCDFTNASTDDELQPFRIFSRTKALDEVLQLQRQLALIVATHRPGTVSSSPTGVLSLPTTKQIKVLRNVVAAGYIDQVAIRADLSPTPPESLRKPKRVTDVPYITLFPSGTNDNATEAQWDKNDPNVASRLKYVYIHPSSVLAHSTSPDKLPQFLVYSHLSRAALTHITTISSGASASTPNLTIPPKTRLHPLVPVTPEQLVSLARGTPLLEDGKPLGKVEVLDRDDKGRERRAVLVVPFLKGKGEEAGVVGWPLPPARRVVQTRVAGKGWVTED